ncbi:MAG UNVERIFIED_CONTAM: Ig-like domain-containing protein [Anaerolineae bacterium]|jgi:hypothetical protein
MCFDCPQYPTGGDWGGCPVPSGELQVTFVTPLEQATYLEGVAVNILARISGAGADIDRVEVLVDNTIIEARFLPNPMGTETFTFTHAWQAVGAGTHTLSLVVFRSNGSSSTPISRTVEVASNADNTLTVASQSESADASANPIEVMPTPSDTTSSEPARRPAPTPTPSEPTALPPPPHPPGVGTPARDNFGRF